MLIRDVMTKKVITVTTDTSVYEARKIMQDNNIRRLPVIDKGKPVGIVSMGRLESISPPKAATITVWELNYLLAKTTVGEIMKRDILVVSPDMTVEEGLSIAQNNKVGTILAVEDGKLAGIATTNDFFYKIVNPVLGLGKGGTRLFIPGAGEGKELLEVISTINRRGVRIMTLFPVTLEEGKKNDLIIHLDTEDKAKIADIMQELKSKNYSVTIRKR